LFVGVASSFSLAVLELKAIMPVASSLHRLYQLSADALGQLLGASEQEPSRGAAGA
jgi:hypothetical protein